MCHADLWRVSGAVISLRRRVREWFARERLHLCCGHSRMQALRCARSGLLLHALVCVCACARVCVCVCMQSVALIFRMFSALHKLIYFSKRSVGQRVPTHSAGGPDNLRQTFSANVTLRDWATTFLPAFEACVGSGGLGLMCSCECAWLSVEKILHLRVCIAAKIAA